MKRFSFFLAVFSVGLVVFLLLTGQFGKLFRAGEENGDGSSASRQEEPEETRNVVTYYNHDYEKGRVRFSLRGVVDGSSSLKLNLDNISSQRSLSDAVLEIPIYGDEARNGEGLAPGLESLSRFVLRAERVWSSLESRSISLAGEITGEGDGGIPRLQTTALDLSWERGGDGRLSGNEAISIQYPAIDLHGKSGLDAVVDEDLGLRNLTIHPPVLTALRLDQEAGVLGFGVDALPGGQAGGRVFVLGDGPLRIDAERDEAVFEGNVAIFQASPDAPLEPPEELPANRFECEGLRLQLDPETRRFTRAIAERGARPVRCYLEGDYQVAGDRLEWSEGDAEALLSGNLRIHGELGEFRARRARIYLRENRSVLEDEVRGHLRGATLSETGGGGEDPWGERLASDWNLEADEAEILHGGGEGRSQLRLFRATSRLPNGVVIREARQDGAVLRGSTIAYDPEQDALTVGALSGREAIRPHFREGRNEIRSQHIQLALSRSELVFTNHVEAIIYDIPAGAVRELPKAFRERRRNDHTSLRCTRLRLAWDPLHRLQELEAWAGETPLILRNEGVDSYSLQGETLRWQAQQGRITLSGAPGEQSLTLQGQARLRAGELRFSVERWMAIGDGGVIAEIERQAILGGRPRGESRQVRVQSDHLEIHFRRPQEPRKKMEKGERAPSKAPVVSARGWSDGGGAVEIADGLLRAQGEELIWRTEAGELLLRGSGRQRIFHLGPGGTDEISAQSIIFREAERKVLLEGEARASLHLVNLGKDAATIAGGGDQAWDLTAGHLEVLLDEVTEEKVAGGTGPRRRLALREVRARDGVTLSHPEEEITFQGAGCEWSHERMRLRVFSPDGQGYQTLYRGSERKDEFVAREITVVRPPERKRDPRDRLLIYAQEVLRATFHREQKGEPRPDVPDTFRLIADNLLLELEMEPAGVDRASRGASKASSAVKEAHAWGNVTFTGEPFKLIAHQAVYLPREQRVVFRGRGSQRVQILSEQGSGFPPSKEVEVFWTTKGYRIRSVPRGFPWHIDDLERDLKLLDQRERTPRE